MSSFSIRKGIKPIKVEVQIDNVSMELRNALWNAVTSVFFARVQTDSFGGYRNRNSAMARFMDLLWHEFFKSTIDSVPSSWMEAKRIVKDFFYKADWNEVYDFIEFVAKTFHSRVEERVRVNEFIQFCNAMLERESSAYRFVGLEIVEITSKEEIGEIEEALNSTFKSTAHHVASALSLMSDKKKPDFRNSIKESISAVEATCNSLLGDNKKSLGDALEELEKKKILTLHSAQKKAFKALYGYTSDADGIRHALTEEDSLLDHSDAKFMLINCSAFCNYLIAKKISK